MASNLNFLLETEGDITTPSELSISLVKILQSGPTFAVVDNTVPFVIRIRVCNEDTYDLSTNATIAPIEGNVVKTWTSAKDLEIETGTSYIGEIRLQLTNATEETVTVRLGIPELSSLSLDYSRTINVTHSASGSHVIVIKFDSYTYVGGDIEFTKIVNITMEGGDYSYLGSDTLIIYKRITILSGNYRYRGSNILLYSYPAAINISSGSYSYNGTDTKIYTI